MKLISYRRKGALHIGALTTDGVAEIDHPSVSGELGAALLAGADLHAAASNAVAKKRHAPGVCQPRSFTRRATAFQDLVHRP